MLMVDHYFIMLNVHIATADVDHSMLLLIVRCWCHSHCRLLQKSMSDTSHTNIMSVMFVLHDCSFVIIRHATLCLLLINHFWVFWPTIFQLTVKRNFISEFSHHEEFLRVTQDWPFQIWHKQKLIFFSFFFFFLFFSFSFYFAFSFLFSFTFFFFFRVV